MQPCDDATFDDPVTAFLDRRDAVFAEHPPLLQYQDGTWAVVDERGRPWTPGELALQLESPDHPALRAAAVDIEPISVTDTPARPQQELE